MLKNNKIKSTSFAILLGGISLFSVAPSSEAQEVISYIPSYTERIMQLQDTVGVHLSEEARLIIERPVTIIEDGVEGYAGLFAPMLFDVSKIQRLAFPYDSIAKVKDLTTLNLFGSTPMALKMARSIGQERYSKSGLNRIIAKWDDAQRLRGDVYMSRPDLISNTVSILPQDRIEYVQIKGAGYTGELEMKDVPNVPIEKAHDLAVGVDRKYWIQHFEADAHFAQNQVSANWHKGGRNSLNLNSRLFYELTYAKERIKWVNNIEYKLGLFTSTESEISVRKLQISEDILRMNSNFGLSAVKNWFYTVDLGIRTQLLQNKSNDNVLITRPFAPVIADAGIGMKYDIDKKEFRGDPFARLRFSANMAPVSGQFIYVWAKNIDNGRVGLRPDQQFLFRLGSSLRANLIWDFSSLVTWTSRFQYTTSYKHVETEFENTLTYALTQHLSTKINISLRYDDSVILDVPKTFKNLLQYNELFSFGFAYKL